MLLHAMELRNDPKLRVADRCLRTGGALGLNIFARSFRTGMTVWQAAGMAQACSIPRNSRAQPRHARLSTHGQNALRTRPTRSSTFPEEKFHQRR